MTKRRHYTQQLEEEGFAVAENVIGDDLLDRIDREYAQHLGDRVHAWASEAGVPVDSPPLAGKTFPEQLLEFASRPGFEPRRLDEFDPCPPYRPLTLLERGCRFFIADSLLDLMRSDEILDLVEPIIGPDVEASPNQHVRLKFPAGCKAEGGSGHHHLGRTILHQDVLTQAPEADAKPLVTCWIPMMDVTEEYGCLLIVPRKHARERLPIPADRELSRELESMAIPVEAKRGDVVLLDKFTPHTSADNRSDAIRWSFDLRLGPVDGPGDRWWFPSCVLRKGGERSAVTAAEWMRSFHGAVDRIVEEGLPLPGSPDFARYTLEQLIKRWNDGTYPVAPKCGLPEGAEASG